METYDIWRSAILAARDKVWMRPPVRFVDNPELGKEAWDLARTIITISFPYAENRVAEMENDLALCMMRRDVYRAHFTRLHWEVKIHANRARSDKDLDKVKALNVAATKADSRAEEERRLSETLVNRILALKFLLGVAADPHGSATASPAASPHRSMTTSPTADAQRAGTQDDI